MPDHAVHRMSPLCCTCVATFAARQLIFLAAGDEALYKARATDFDAMGKAKFFFGALGGGTRVKLAVNMVTGTRSSNLTTPGPFTIGGSSYLSPRTAYYPCSSGPCSRR
jgi:hypothetical protein